MSSRTLRLNATRLRRIPAVAAIVLGVVSGAASGAWAADRADLPLGAGWRFHQGDVAPGKQGGPEAPAFNDKGWATVSLPHTWNHLGGTARRTADYNATRGAGWYRLRFTPPASYAGRKVWLQFDGASINAEVWLNGVKLGAHQGAFGRFRFDATAALKLGKPNVLAVRTDNSSPAVAGSPTAEVIPMSGDFFLFGGLYRAVSLIATDPVHIDMMDSGGPGVYAHTASLDGAAGIEVNSRVKNDGAKPQPVVMKTAIVDAAGATVASDSQPLTVAPGAVAEPQQTLTVPNPHLWDGRGDPYLYHVVTRVETAQGQLLDQVTQPLGIRSFRFDPDQGFFLNGKHVALHGVSRHQDRPGKGWAISPADQAQDMDIMLDLGINTLRLAHYQHDQAIYDLADKDGVVVWAEIPLVNRTAPETPEGDTGVTSPGFAANAESQLRELIKQNYNHPSVVTWSIGNEVNLMAAAGHGVSNARPLLTRLNQAAYELDHTRPTTMADCCEPWPDQPKPGVDVVAEITDLLGYNRYQGWYYDKAEDLGPVLDRLHALHPRLPLAVSEYGAGGALSQHTDQVQAGASQGGVVYPKGHFHPEDLESRLHEIWWAQLKARPYLWGTFIWTMFDFASDSRTEGDMIDTNDKGLVSYDRTVKKDVFFFYKADWSDQPVLHLNGRRYVDRAYPVTDVEAYSNAATARLTLNGRDLGAAACPDHVCRWPAVHLDAGDNVLTAMAEIEGQSVSDSITWRFAGKPDEIHIRAGASAGLTSATGARYGSDAFATGGEPHDRNPAPEQGRPDKTIPPVTGTSDPTLYETYRAGAFGYRVPVPAGRYQVTLRFAEPMLAPGARVFDVAANGHVVLQHLDVAAEAGGPLAALDRTVTVEVTGDDGLALDFRPVTGPALVSAIDVVPAR
ncbi:glycoside hydrolase family 2 TIM barrel-domain containing protein [Nitrospirillum sp. BR 11828]|uniref:glycoside hydrolase family 2 TIM barrel-domain containing protein n=1 Tax=Nitrospirillum sp. BR 11828 TaxID=3104325 RepID=UPI002ACA2C64|nr:glycoside hydrolase family 2 TIM barrel-domain containing protein [Nitrospirillum sp. BR 11828]MDZ5647107.1 glycoside hydrolase family 2 TIM barrel-domain containing protein [Nitrospirillum sp. BR 11828]